ncbi:uncharacterized protein LOC131021501 [Salvia miltiorrhiza]|uniref:uncharacterized protein LOC131021501 n=1 Tax=Salvia miltiorrhiza TaxID=226208 RepID=UPI0025ABB035|nr:uncharacterized protein LOC131021501 [Salvia miltiorrhiza]
MEIEKRQPEIGKKAWNIVRVMVYMMRRSNAKRKMMVELNSLMKKGKNASKALSKLILHHHHHYSCRSNDVNASFVSPRDYEFSCSNTPLPKRKKHGQHYQAEELKVMHKVLGILSRYEEVEASPAGGVDKDAEEFINKFYRELKKQRPIDALATPSPYHQWAT